MKNVLNIEELNMLSEAINFNLFDFNTENVEVIIKLEKEMLDKLNEEFYYRHDPNADPNKLKQADEIKAVMNGINFKFIKNNPE